MQSTLEVLTAARAKIADPAHWTKGSWARTSSGTPADSDDEAVCWCSWGALITVGAESSATYLAEDALDKACGEGSIINYNDRHSHAEVIAIWDLAIAAEQAR